MRVLSLVYQSAPNVLFIEYYLRSSRQDITFELASLPGRLPRVAVRARGGLANKRSIWDYSLSTTPKNVHTRRHPLRIIPRVGVVYIHHLTVRASHHIAEVIVLAQRE